jgi:hypothetical protein
MLLRKRVTDTATPETATAVFFTGAVVVSAVVVGVVSAPSTATANPLAGGSADDIVGTADNTATPATMDETGENESVFNVSNLTPGADTAAALDDTLVIAATVRNTGDAEGTQTVEYRIGDTVITSRNVTIGAGNSTTVEFDGLNVSDLDTGEYEHGVFTDDDSQTADLRLYPAGDDRVVVDRVDGDDDDDNESEVEEGGDGGNGSTDDGALGFGVLAAFAALTAAALISARLNE